MKQYEIVIPSYGVYKIDAMPASAAIKGKGPNVVDSAAVAEAKMSKDEVIKLRNALDSMIANKFADELFLFVREAN